MCCSKILASTYFESSPPFPEDDKRRYGYSRDHRRDCVQVVIALVVTPEGLPLAYEVLPGNTSDKTTLRDFLARIERESRQGAARVGDGARHSDGRDPRTDAQQRPAGTVSRRHAQGTIESLGSWT